MKYTDNVLERIEQLEDELVQLKRRMTALEFADQRGCHCSGPFEECDICLGT